MTRYAVILYFLAIGILSMRTNEIGAWLVCLPVFIWLWTWAEDLDSEL